MKTIIYSARADQQLSRLNPETAGRIEAKLEHYAMTGQADVKALRGVTYRGLTALRLRVGDYRVIFTEDLHVVDVEDVGHRASVYR